MPITIIKTSTEGWVDDFNRADSETVGNGWIDDDSNNWRISSNKLLQDSTANDELYHTNDVDKAGEETYIVKWTLGTTASTAFVFRRNEDAGLKMYQLVCQPSGGGRTHFYYYDGGFTRFASSLGEIGVVGTVRWFKLVCVGYVFTCYYSTNGIDWILMLWGAPTTGGIDPTVTDPNSTSLHGVIGWRAGGNSGMTIDEVTVAPDYVTIKNIALDSFLDGLYSETDEFLRADSETVGGIWTDTGADSWQITSHELHNDTTDGDDIYAEGVDYTDTLFYVEMKWLANGSANLVICKTNGVGFYQVAIDNSSGSVTLYREYGGFTQLAQDTTMPSFSIGTYVRFAFSLQGSILRCLYNVNDGNGWIASIKFEDTTGLVTHGHAGFRSCPQLKVAHVHILPYRQINRYYDNPEVEGADIADNPTYDNVYSIDQIYFNGKWRRYFGTQKDTKDRIMHQESDDLETWTEPEEVLTAGAADEWDDNHINDPSCIVVGSTLYMYFTGQDGATDRIGVATSTDGINFTKYGSNPIIDVEGAGSWSELTVARPTVIKEGSAWHMWADGKPALPGKYGVGYWSSTDGYSWTPDGGNPIFGGVASDLDVSGINVIKEGSSYYMQYQGWHSGTRYAVGSSETSFVDKGLLLTPIADKDWNKGTVMPYLFIDGVRQQLFWGGSTKETWDGQRICSAYFHKKIDIKSSGRSIVNEILAINDTDIRVSTTDVGSITIKVYDDFTGTTEIASETFTLARGDVYRVSYGNVPIFRRRIEGY